MCTVIQFHHCHIYAYVLPANKSNEQLSRVCPAPTNTVKCTHIAKSAPPMPFRHALTSPYRRPYHPLAGVHASR